MAKKPRNKKRSTDHEFLLSGTIRPVGAKKSSADEKQRKLVLDVPERLHKKLKRRAVDLGVTMRSLVVDWLQNLA